MNVDGDAFYRAAEAQYDALPPISTLDEYIHFQSELEAMRARSDGRFVPEKFGLEMSVYIRLMDYCRSLGLPIPAMPGPDGKGGVSYPSIVPSAWLLD